MGRIQELVAKHPELKRYDPVDIAEVLYRREGRGQSFIDFSRDLGLYDGIDEPAEASPATGPQTPEMTMGRLGGALREGAKDVGRNAVGGFQMLSEGAFGANKHARGAYDIAKQPFETDPEYKGHSSGFIEDVVRAVPQFGAQIGTALVNPAASGAMMFQQIAGGTYNDLLDKGVDPGRAQGAALANAVLQTPLEYLGAASVLGKAGKMAIGNIGRKALGRGAEKATQSTVLRRVKEWASRTGGEALTEFLQEYPDAATQLWAENPDLSVFEQIGTYLDDLPKTTKNAAYAGLIGAVLGGAASSPTLAYDVEENTGSESNVSEPDKYSDDDYLGFWEDAKREGGRWNGRPAIRVGQKTNLIQRQGEEPQPDAAGFRAPGDYGVDNADPLGIRLRQEYMAQQMKPEEEAQIDAPPMPGRFSPQSPEQNQAREEGILREQARQAGKELPAIRGIGLRGGWRTPDTHRDPGYDLIGPQPGRVEPAGPQGALRGAEPAESDFGPVRDDSADILDLRTQNARRIKGVDQAIRMPMESPQEKPKSLGQGVDWATPAYQGRVEDLSPQQWGGESRAARDELHTAVGRWQNAADGSGGGGLDSSGRMASEPKIEDTIVLTARGKPFVSERSAQKAAQTKQAPEGVEYRPVKIRDGWGLRQHKVEAAKVLARALDRTSETLFKGKKSDGGGGQPTMFKRERPQNQSSDTTRGMARADVQKSIRGLLGANRGLSGKVEVVDIEENLPVDIYADASQQGLLGGGFHGAYHDGKIYIVAGNIKHADEAERVLLHESRHMGLENVMGGTAAKDKVMSRVAEIWKKDVDVFLKNHDIADTKANRIMAAEEVIVDGIKRGRTGRAIDMVVARVMSFIRQVFPDLKITKAEARDLIAKADAFVEKGKADVKGSDSKPTAAPAYSRRTMDAPPDLADALGNIGEQDEPLIERMQSWLAEINTGLGDRLVQGLADQYKSLDRLDKMYAESGVIGGEDLGNAYMLARMTASLGDMMKVIFTHGAPKIKNGWVAVSDKDKGLVSILEPVARQGDVTFRLPNGQEKTLSAVDRFLYYQVGKRAQRLLSEGRENLFDPKTINALLSLKPESNAEAAVWTKAWKEYNQYRSAILDFAQENGVIDGEARKVWERDDYVPFYRLRDDGAIKGPKGQAGIANQKSGVRRLFGGQDNIGDPLENIVTNLSHLVEASLKNRAANTAMEKMIDLGFAFEAENGGEYRRASASTMATALRNLMGDKDAVWPMTKNERESFLNIYLPTAPKGADVMSVLKGGKPTYYHVRDPLLYRSMTSINREALNVPSLKLFRGLKQILTTGVTVDPAFRVANLLRDTASTWAVTDNGFVPMLDSLKGAVKAYKNDDDALAVAAAGGTFSGGWTWAGDNSIKTEEVRRLLREKGIKEGTVLDSPKKITDFMKKAWRWWEDVGSASENAARIATHKRVLTRGKSEGDPEAGLRAAFEARDVMDFSLRGDWKAMQYLTAVVPFLGARIQGIYKLGRGAAVNPKAFALKGGTIAAASLLLYLWNRDDDRYKELEEWDKDIYYHFWLGDQHFRLPKPFEVGFIFGTIPERMAEATLNAAAGKGDPKLLADRIAWGLGEVFAFNPLPQGVKQAAEQWANKSFFTGAPIVGQGLEGNTPAMQYEPWTSPTAREVGKATGMSPKRIESVVRGLFGALGTYVLGATDVVVRNLGDYPNPPASDLSDLRVIRRFYKGDDVNRRTRYGTQFYEALKEVNALYQDVIDLARNEGKVAEARDLARRNMGKLKHRKMMNRVSRATSEIRGQIDKIWNSRTLTPDKKKERIDALQKKLNEVYEKSYKAVAPAFR